MDEDISVEKMFRKIVESVTVDMVVVDIVETQRENVVSTCWSDIDLFQLSLIGTLLDSLRSR
jgi:hypothetical protein